MSPITTHVLDTSLGCPAEGIAVTLYRMEEDGACLEVGRSVTNSDGRAADLLADGKALAGTYRLEFDTAAYFARSRRPSFYPRVDIHFEVTTEGEHYHVPLLLSPFGYSTYRGS
ncbi:MAG: hydroxyisourate hydrolase [Planctomycetes bacterium]|nr:hydroxyisourate hydrolase [Planctomycetota bacterium]